MRETRARLRVEAIAPQQFLEVSGRLPVSSPGVLGLGQAQERVARVRHYLERLRVEPRRLRVILAPVLHLGETESRVLVLGRERDDAAVHLLRGIQVVGPRESPGESRHRFPIFGMALEVLAIPGERVLGALHPCELVGDEERYLDLEGRVEFERCTRRRDGVRVPVFSRCFARFRHERDYPLRAHHVDRRLRHPGQSQRHGPRGRWIQHGERREQDRRRGG